METVAGRADGACSNVGPSAATHVDMQGRLVWESLDLSQISVPDEGLACRGRSLIILDPKDEAPLRAAHIEAHRTGQIQRSLHTVVRLLVGDSRPVVVLVRQVHLVFR